MKLTAVMKDIEKFLGKCDEVHISADDNVIIVEYDFYDPQNCPELDKPYHICNWYFDTIFGLKSGKKVYRKWEYMVRGLVDFTHLLPEGFKE